MADVFFFEEGCEPRPKEAVRIEELKAEPYADGHRVRITITLTAFVERPNLRIVVTNSAGDPVASSDVLELISPRNELTLHVRGPQPEGKYTVRAELYYDEPELLETKEAVFSMLVQ